MYSKELYDKVKSINRKTRKKLQMKRYIEVFVSYDFATVIITDKYGLTHQDIIPYLYKHYPELEHLEITPILFEQIDEETAYKLYNMDYIETLPIL